jgi:signal transduction histidine kinase
MRQRIKEFGGEVRVKNANPGTVVEVVVPFQRAVREQREPAP